MKRSAILLLSAAACTGTIGGDDPTMVPSTTVTVQVHDSSMPIAGVNVIFQNADETVLLEAATGADGTAVAEMPDGGMVTVIRTFPPPVNPDEEQRPAELYTYVGVHAGDVLNVTGELDITRGTPNAINVKVPELSEGTVRIMTPCGTGEGTGTTIPMTVIGCAQMVPFYVMDGTGQSFLLRAPISENVDLSAGSYADSLGTSISSTNKPLDITSITAEKRIEADGYELASSGTKRVDETAQNIDLPMIFGVDEVLVTAFARSGGGTQIVSARAPYNPGPTIIDGNVGRIPYTTKVQTTPLGVTWSEDDAMGLATGTVDFVIAAVNVTRPDPTGGPYDVEFVRYIVAPHGTPNLRIPQLPDPLYNPVTDDTIAGSLALVAVTGGYDAARGSVFSYGSLADIAPMNGTVTISYTGSAPR